MPGTNDVRHYVSESVLLGTTGCRIRFGTLSSSPGFPRVSGPPGRGTRPSSSLWSPGNHVAEIAIESDVIIYDALSLAPTEYSGTIMVTADKISHILEDTPYAHLAHSFADVSSLIPSTG